MSFTDQLSFGFWRHLPLLLQTEKTECGLACLGMIASYHGHVWDLPSLRRAHPISQKGVTLTTLIQIAGAMNLGARPLKLDLDDLVGLKLPCVLHWNFNHFVVLKSVSDSGITIYDPASGVRKLSLSETSKSFTGIALELWPNPGFTAEADTLKIKIRDLLGHITGVGASFAQIIILAMCLEVFAMVSPFFIQWTIDNAIVTADRDLLTTLAVGFGLLMVMQQAVSAIRSWVIIYMGTTLNIQWRANVFTHLLQLPIQYFEKRHLGDVVSRFGTVDMIQSTLTTSFLEAILDGIMTLVTLILMFYYSSTLGWIAVATMSLYGLTRWAWYGPLRKATEEQIIHAAKQQSHFLESIRGVKAIKLFQKNLDRRSSWLSLLSQQINAGLRTQRLQLIYKLLNGLLFGVENILVIVLGARMVMEGQFTIGALMAFNSYKGQFDSRVSSLIDKFFEVKMLQLQAERLADIVMTEPESSGESMLGEHETLQASIAVTGLSYRYSPQEPVVLNNISFSVSPGESVAIVGPSGCGKTTLLNVLLGILPMIEGDVFIGNRSLRTLGTGLLRKTIGTVLQDDVLFAGSIAENISFFDQFADQAWIAQCAAMAAIAHDIENMPMGYNTLVGDMGTVLSGGQKQRVLIARALYKRPSILLLDEATSHLDIDNEKRVNAVIASLNITRIIIAHRPETIASADRVITLSNGSVVEDRSHYQDHYSAAYELTS